MPTEILLPAPTADFEEGTIESWHKSEGDWVEAGEVLLDIETDKALIEVEALHSGILGKILFPGGSENVAVNTVVGLLLSDGESADEVATHLADDGVKSESASASASASASEEGTGRENDSSATSGLSSESTGENRFFASPLARRIATLSGLDISELKGRGPNGRILKADVELAIESAAQVSATAGVVASPSVPLGEKPAGTTTDANADRLAGSTASSTESKNYTALPNSKMRKVIARRLSESKRDVPHFYLNVDCEIDALLALRKEINGKSPEGDGAYKLSVNDFIIKASALALRDVPAANASWTEDAIHQYKEVDISVAVATPGGLITPIVRNADVKGLATLSDEVKNLAARARDGKLQPHEYQGGGFSISNLGMFGIKQFSAIVNPPQSCILAVGAGEQRPVVRDGELAVATVMSCTLSVDHRTVDGAVGAEFLQAIKKHLENPMTMLLRAG